MLSREDSRRLAQLERQLLQEDPEFCARMTAGQPTVAPPPRSRRKHPPISLILTAVIAWISAVVLAALGWWIAAGASAFCATAVLIGMVHLARRRHGRTPETPAGGIS